MIATQKEHRGQRIRLEFEWTGLDMERASIQRNQRVLQAELDSILVGPQPHSAKDSVRATVGAYAASEPRMLTSPCRPYSFRSTSSWPMNLRLPCGSSPRIRRDRKVLRPSGMSASA